MGVNLTNATSPYGRTSYCWSQSPPGSPCLSYIRIPRARHQKIRRIALSWAFPTVTSTLDFATNSGSEVLVASATDNGGLPSYPRPPGADSRARKGTTRDAMMFQRRSGRVTNAATAGALRNRSREGRLRFLGRGRSWRRLQQDCATAASYVS
ncbi:uncharacterized protein SCHCODRAFT_02363554 [Schizophyllum commune H4-8]|uniref:uncharacterized protein n=1 Tax=Schizophyllum commune (strain H4-8 / FGSC 9210) TaxID=578458 RepID=UPI00215FF075|nr:uncharacterized protein SCHCODRAFT_02363554 [Schizophyllum commune H4-8]KAI5889250.1 hypothetical protein SCHCODRAFT_02363554 [Schizophyllum commune H4-8]